MNFFADKKMAFIGIVSFWRLETIESTITLGKK